jgi:hypothetical protein
MKRPAKPTATAKVEDDLSPDHLRRLVQQRSANQELSLELFLMLKSHAEVLSKDSASRNIAQALVAASFSLWRAVFLSDKVTGSTNVLAAAESFLGGLVLHNTVAYQQDRNARNWTFNYYVNNARYRLQGIAGKRLNILPSNRAQKGNRDPKDHWTYYHDALNIAVKNFERKLRDLKISD